MKAAPLIAVALILCIAFPCQIQAKKKPKPKFCVGKDRNQYSVGQGYDDNDGKACVHYKCVKKKKKFVMKKGKCVEDGEWSSWSSWSACSSTCGSATKTRERTCSSPAPSNGGNPCSGPEEQIEQCSNPSCGPDVNVKVDSLELNVQSLNDSVRTLQTTMLSVLEVMTTMQSASNKQGTCMRDLSSSDCPNSAPGKIGFVDGINAIKAGVTSTKADININKADINTNIAGINNNKAGIISTKTDINTNKASINTNKAGIMSTKADINANKASINTNTAGITSTKADINTNKAAIAHHHTDPVLIHTDADYEYYKVPVPRSSKMLSALILSICSQHGMQPQCYNSDYGDNICVKAPSIHSVHPRGMSQILCSTSSPQDCASTLNMFWYINPDKNWESGSACGATKVAFCSSGKNYTSTSDMQYFAACLRSVTPDSRFEECVDKWCLQHGTNEQYTRCEEARDGGDTCVNPQVKYGTTEGGIPVTHDNNDYNAWCKQIFNEEETSSVTLGPRDCSAPKGRLFWCSTSDELNPKWCDWKDGFWKDSTLDMHSYCHSSITSLTCRKDWTIIQRRGQYGNAEDYFYKDFKDYENGFGSVYGELWIGLKKLAALTEDGEWEWELHVDLTDWDDKKYHAKYGTFSVGPAPNYKLHLGGFKDGESTLGDSLAVHNGSAFSSRDKDMDITSDNCAEKFKGGWWYKACYDANLNGLNFAQQTESDYKGMIWYFGKARGNGWKTWKASVMKMKPVKVLT